MAENLSAALGWQLADAVRGMVKDKTQPSTGTATYVGTDRSGRALILFPGADQPTPVHGSISAKADVGSTVTYSLSNGQLSITGNATDPAVGESKASEIASVIVRPLEVAQKATDAAVGVARSVADAAKRVADATNQHFFADDSGIHVTNATQEEWDSQHSGPNVLINSLGQLFRDGMTNLLSLLPAQSQTDTFTGDGSTVAFTLSNEPSAIVSVSVAEADCNDYTVSGATLTLGFAPDDGDDVEVVYRTSETAIVIWDGLGNAAENILAQFGKTVRIGKSVAEHIELLSAGDRAEFDIYGVSGSSKNMSLYTKTTHYGGGNNPLTLEETGIRIGEDSVSSGSRITSYVSSADSRLYIETGSSELENTAATSIKTARQNSSDPTSSDSAEFFATLAGYPPYEVSAGLTVEQGSDRGSLSISVDEDSTGSSLILTDISRMSIQTWNGSGYSSVDMYPTRGVVGQTNTVPAGGYKNVTVSFDHTYSSAPTVVVGLNSSSTSSSIGQCSVAVASVNTTGFTARLFNAGSSDRSPGFYWMALG